MILIYADVITSRLKYIGALLFSDLLGVSVSFSSSLSEFENYSSPKLNYSKNKPVTGVFMECVELLFQSEIKPQPIIIKKNQGEISFFATTTVSDFAFDLFAASFYLVTRYEEYTGFVADRHGRFDAKASLAYRHSFLQQPLVNQWAQLLKQKLLIVYPNLVFPATKFRYISTIDIDNGYSYKGKGIARSLGAVGKAVIKGRFNTIADRILTLVGARKDPFDHYELQKQLKEKYDVRLIYFFLFASKSRYDGGLSPHSKTYHQLIKQISSYADIGIHPSYASHRSKAALQKELSTFSEVTGYPNVRSRQHFLKFILPKTYTDLTELGIREDYSMGYAAYHGFRASICTPYYFYDLKRNVSTELKLIPTTVMDATLMEYQKRTPEQALVTIKQLMQEVKRVDGVFVSIWHERFFSNTAYYQGWREVYEEMLKEAQRLMNYPA